MYRSLLAKRSQFHRTDHANTPTPLLSPCLLWCNSQTLQVAFRRATFTTTIVQESNHQQTKSAYSTTSPRSLLVCATKRTTRRYSRHSFDNHRRLRRSEDNGLFNGHKTALSLMSGSISSRKAGIPRQQRAACNFTRHGSCIWVYVVPNSTDPFLYASHIAHDTPVDTHTRTLNIDSYIGKYTLLLSSSCSGSDL